MTTKRIYLLLSIALCLPILVNGQSSEMQSIIELGKTYKNFMFVNEPTSGTLKEIKSDVPPELKDAEAFLIQTITTNNKLLKKNYLTLPDEKTLTSIYLIEAVSANLHEDEPMDNKRLLDSLMVHPASHYEMVDNYYDMLFTGVGNKIQPFDLSEIDFSLKEYKLADDVEKGIFFLQCMSLCESQVWGFMNIVKPANTGKAYQEIKKFPLFNGQPYYQYNDFSFPDFTRLIDKEKGPESYKHYYINKYYELLLYHLACLQKEGASEKERQRLMLGSIIKESKYYRYTSYKDVLSGMLHEVLQFKSNFIDGVNKWIAMEPDSVNNYNYGFVYIDEQAGPTLQLGGTFKINDAGTFIPNQSTMDMSSVKIRLEPSNRRVAILPESSFSELGISEQPDWLKFYQTDTGSVKSLYVRGFIYNGWSRPEKALPYLLRAQKLDPNYPGLIMEMAFSFNALEQYDKTIALLKNAPDRITNPCYYYKELSYAYIHHEQLEVAADTAKAGLLLCNDKLMKAEIAFNIAGAYYRRKDGVNFKYWATQTSNWSNPDDQFSEGIKKMEEGMKK